MMDLTIRTMQGSCNLKAIPAALTVEEFKKTLHDAAVTKRLTGLQIPFPDNQNIIHKGHTVVEGSLQEAGIRSGDAIVILTVPNPPEQTQKQEMRGPCAEEIAVAIRSYAVKHGLESKLADPDKPRTAQRTLRLTDNPVLGTGQMQAIIDALEMSLGRDSSTNETQNEEEQQTEEEVQVPEPDAGHMCTLTEQMGIQEEVARKALILNRNNITAAVNWICEHENDEDLTDPIPPAVLHALYRRRRRRNRIEQARPDRVQQMVEMGFDEEESRDALVRMRNNVHLAISLLTLGPGEARDATAIDSDQAPPLEPRSEENSAVNQSGTPSSTRTEGDPSQAVEDELHDGDEQEDAPEQSVPLASLEWSHVEEEEADDMPEEPPSSEVNLDLVGDVDDDIIVDPSDFDQGVLGGVSLEDVERVLGGDGDTASSRALYPQLRRLLEEMDPAFLEHLSGAIGDEEGGSADTEASAFLGRLRELLDVLGSNDRTADPYGAGPSGEAQDDA